MVGRNSLSLVTLAISAALMMKAGWALPCDPGNPCMTGGMCATDGSCPGTPLTGPACTLPADALCGTGSHCMDGTCTPDAIGSAPAGTSCAGGCGACQQLFPGFTQCSILPGKEGQPCDPGVGPCIDGLCSASFGVPFCSPSLKMCPRTSQDPCITDSCNPTSGKCESFGCVPECQTCTATGCQPTNLGGSCTYLGQCPVAAASCQIQPEVGISLCLPGTSATTATPTGTPGANSPTPTRTSTVQQPSPTPTHTTEVPPPPTATNTVKPSTSTPTRTKVIGTATPTLPPGLCVCDCNHDGKVATNELVDGVEIMLDVFDLGTCPECDPTHDGIVAINEFVLAVEGSVHGCGEAASVR